MALFSDIDWIILAGVAALLIFGSRDGAGVMRTIGRYYARLMTAKQQMFDEVAKAADLPPSTGGRPAGLRAALLGTEDGRSTWNVSAIPAVVTTPPSPAYRPTHAPEIPWTGPGLPTPTWSVVVLPPVAAGVQEGER